MEEVYHHTYEQNSNKQNHCATNAQLNWIPASDTSIYIEAEKSKLQDKLKKLNDYVFHYHQLQIGNLFSHELTEIDKTIQFINAILQQKNRLNANLSESTKQIKLLRLNMAQKERKIQILSKEIEEQKKKYDELRISLQNQIKEAAAANRKLTKQRDELSKTVSKMEGRQNQFNNEFRKKDLTIKGLQETAKTRKNEVQFKNNFDLSENLNNALNQYFVNTFEQNECVRLNHIDNQNTKLKLLLCCIVKETNQIFQMFPKIRMNVIAPDTMKITKFNEEQGKLFCNQIVELKHHLRSFIIKLQSQTKRKNEMKSINNLEKLYQTLGLYKTLCFQQNDLIKMIISATQLKSPLNDVETQEQQFNIQELKANIEWQKQDLEKNKQQIYDKFQDLQNNIKHLDSITFQRQTFAHKLQESVEQLNKSAANLYAVRKKMEVEAG